MNYKGRPKKTNCISRQIYQALLELFSWKTTSHKDHLEVYLPISRVLYGLSGMWSSMKITLIKSYNAMVNNWQYSYWQGFKKRSWRLPWIQLSFLLLEIYLHSCLTAAISRGKCAPNPLFTPLDTGLRNWNPKKNRKTIHFHNWSYHFVQV